MTELNSSLKPRGAGDYVVLLYHGVYSDDLELEGRNSSGKHISASEFDDQMSMVAREWNVVSMLDIGRAHAGVDSLPPRAVAVTIDDGFANIYHNAWPILRERGIRATFYLATGLIGTEGLSWTDRLEIMILDAPPGPIHLSIGEQQLKFDLDDTATRVGALTNIKALCKQLPYRLVEEILRQVQAATAVQPASSHPLYAMLDWDQVRDMSGDGLLDFGAHTVDHIPLTRMTFEEMTGQVKDSLRKVSDETGVESSLFSYPEGQIGDFDDASIDFLKSLELPLCPTAIEGLNNVGRTDPFHINRCMVGFEGRPFVLA